MVTNVTQKSQIGGFFAVSVPARSGCVGELFSDGLGGMRFTVFVARPVGGCENDHQDAKNE
jgi:hypothetical protein